MDRPVIGAIQAEEAVVEARIAARGSDPPFNITLHTLRHTSGSWLAMEGVPLRAIRKLMGHRSITTTERYAHLSGKIWAPRSKGSSAFYQNHYPAPPKRVKLDQPTRLQL